MNDVKLTALRFSMHIYEVRPRKDHRGVDLISDALPFGRPYPLKDYSTVQIMTSPSCPGLVPSGQHQFFPRPCLAPLPLL